MRFKRIAKASVVFCIAAILGIAACGCDDLGAYEDTDEYYSSFGDIALISGTATDKTDKKEYSVEEYFYNKESRDHFLEGENGAYGGVEHGDYVYMAIPFESDIQMDSIALFLQSEEDVTVYISVFVAEDIPSNWKAISDLQPIGGASGGVIDDSIFDDPRPDTRIGEVKVGLKKGKWGSFVLDDLTVNGAAQESIQIKDGQYVLLQIRNNSGVRKIDDTKQIYVDTVTGDELTEARITMTNLLIRALEMPSAQDT